MEAQPYLIIAPGILTEKVVGGGDNPEKLAEDMETLARQYPGKTLTLRGPNGELVHAATYIPKEK